MARIEQLENLRRLFLRHNRSFDRNAGVKARFGREDIGRDSGEPCQLLLDKIDRMKEQRVNQTAHLILAEALGVRLKPHEISHQERRQRDIHGEYERIPGRAPVDFIVIENLDRYLTSQGRAPSENSRLMKWSHRAVREKIKMLAEEPFGIPVVETAAAYSSCFSAKTGSPGFRGEERTTLGEKRGGILKKRMDRSAKPGQPKRSDYKALLDQFAELEKLNERRAAAEKTLHSLCLPRPGGPLFFALDAATPCQADINAAINLGLRAVAAPESLHLIHKIRTEWNRAKSIAPLPVQRNAREKAMGKAQVTIRLEREPSGKLSKAANPNFFYDHNKDAEFDAGTIFLPDGSMPIASGVGFWSTVNAREVSHIVFINEKRLSGWRAHLGEDEEDDIPFSFEPVG